jgi:hypothetical protein
MIRENHRFIEMLLKVTPFLVTTKNDSISGIDTANLRSLSSESCSIVDAITLPTEVNYSYQ